MKYREIGLSPREIKEGHIYLAWQSGRRGVAFPLEWRGTYILLPVQYYGVPFDDIPWSVYQTWNGEGFFLRDRFYFSFDLVPDDFPCVWEIMHILDDLSDMEKTSLCGFNLSEERLLSSDFDGFEIPEKSRGSGVDRQVTQVSGIYKPLCHTCLWRSPKTERSK